jgi:hypothetical protein
MLAFCPSLFTECHALCWTADEQHAPAVEQSITPQAAANSRAFVESCDNEMRLGMISERGRSSVLEFEGGGLLCRESSRRRWTLEAEAMSSTRNGSNVLSQSLDYGYEYRLAHGWYGVVNVSEEADRDIGLASRVLFAPGIGVDIRPWWGGFAAEAGLSRTRENNQGAPPRNFPEIWTATETRWKIRSGVVLREALSFYARTENTADHRWESRTSLSLKLIGRLSLETGVTFKWDNIPASQYPKTSIRTRTALKYSFEPGNR